MPPRPQGQPDRGAGSIWSRGFWVALGLVALAAPLAAQSLLCVENDGKLGLVRRAEGSTAFVLEDGKWVRYEEGHFVLKPTAEYLPVLIAVHDRYFKKGARAISDKGAAHARLIHAGRFVFNANLEAPCALDNVVLMLALVGDNNGDMLYLWGIGHLDAHQSKRVSIDETTLLRLTGVRLAGLHLFVDGREAFSSEIPDSKRAAALDRMVASRVAAVQDAEPQPLFVSDPIYPAALKTKMKGRAVIAFRVDEHGRVLEPAVASETDPAFGAAALEAIRQWRFVPRVKGGAPVESAAETPFVFDPPP